MKQALLALALILLFAVPMQAAVFFVAITKSNQSVEFDLSAVEDADGMVHVKMRIPQDSFDDFSSATLKIERDDKTILSTPIAIKRDSNGAIRLSFDIASELADDCYIDIWTTPIFSGIMYEIELKGYVTK